MVLSRNKASLLWNEGEKKEEREKGWLNFKLAIQLIGEQLGLECLLSMSTCIIVYKKLINEKRPARG